jgi:hypothetical protein
LAGYEGLASRLLSISASWSKKQQHTSSDPNRISVYHGGILGYHGGEFICSVFNDAVSNSHYIALDDGVINE